MVDGTLNVHTVTAVTAIPLGSIIAGAGLGAFFTVRLLQYRACQCNAVGHSGCGFRAKVPQ